MAENNRNQDQASGSKQQNQDMNQSNQKQNTSGQQDQNSQRGSQWNNYQTREISGEGYSGENIPSEEGEEA